MNARDDLRDCFLSDSRDRFEAAANAYRAEVLQQAIASASAEHLHQDDTGTPEDEAYNQGVRDAIAAVEKLIKDGAR